MSLKNKLLTITRSIVPYVKELRPIAKSVASCILMQQMDYWFNKQPSGFYKFLEPSPANENYQEGDSWVEELGFSAEEFKTAFSNIGVAYKSKTEFEQASSKFFTEEGKEKFYCSYFDRQSKLTFYFRNHSLVDKFLAKLVFSIETDNAGLPETDNPGLLENNKSLPRNRQPRFVETDNPGLQKPATPVCFKRISETTTEITQEGKRKEFVEHSFDTSASLLPPVISQVAEEPIQTNLINQVVELSEPDVEEQEQELEPQPKPSRSINATEEKKPLNSQQALLEAFASLLCLNMAIYKGGWPRLAKEIQLFSKAKITAQDVNKFASYWYSEDFRGQKGEPPTLPQVVQRWEIAKAWQDPSEIVISQPSTTIAVRQYQQPQKLNRVEQNLRNVDIVFSELDKIRESARKGENG